MPGFASRWFTRPNLVIYPAGTTDRAWRTVTKLTEPSQTGNNLLTTLYKKQRAKVRVARVMSHWLPVRKGRESDSAVFRHRTDLLNILAEMAMRETLSGLNGGTSGGSGVFIFFGGGGTGVATLSSKGAHN